MMIDKISRMNQVNTLQNTKRVSGASNVASFADEINVSAEAKEMADAFYLSKVADETSDVRADVVERIKLKIQDPNYLNEATIAATADQILSAYGL